MNGPLPALVFADLSIACRESEMSEMGNLNSAKLFLVMMWY